MTKKEMLEQINAMHKWMNEKPCALHCIVPTKNGEYDFFFWGTEIMEIGCIVKEFKNMPYSSLVIGERFNIIHLIKKLENPDIKIYRKDNLNIDDFLNQIVIKEELIWWLKEIYRICSDVYLEKDGDKKDECKEN